MQLVSPRTIVPDMSKIEKIRNWPGGRPLRVLFVSDGMYTTSGYGKQALLAVAAINALGAEVAALSSYGLSGAHLDAPELPGVKIYSAGADGFGNDVIPLAAKDWRADVVITLKDTPVYNVEMMQKLRWAPLTPIDHEPIPPPVMHAIRHAWWPIAYAPNGTLAMDAAGLHPLYASHAYDPAVFKPGDREEARKRLGWPQDKQIVATVAVNRGGLPSRKAWPQLMDAMGQVRRAMGEDAPLWYCHTYICKDGYEGGVNLEMLSQQHGLTGGVFFPDQAIYRYGGFDEQYLAAVYQAADLLLAVSVGEGFGVPILEAQACGTPALVGRWTAPEHLAWTEPQLTRADAVPFLDQQGANIWLPRPDRIAAAVQQHLTQPADTTQMNEVVQEYTIQRVADLEWREVLVRMAERIHREDRHGRGVMRIIRPEEVLG